MPESTFVYFPLYLKQRDKMDAISQTTFSNAFSWMKMLHYRLKFHWGLFLNIPALVQIMAWRRPGDKPLYGPMMVRLPTHLCVTRPQWVNSIFNQVALPFPVMILARIRWIFLTLVPAIQNTSFNSNDPSNPLSLINNISWTQRILWTNHTLIWCI